MDSFDCIYNARQGFCRRLPGTSQVDPQCEIVDNRCVAKTQADTVQSISSVFKEPSVLTEPKVLPVSKEKLTQLSGPISAYSGTYNGKNYYFFGDAHFSMDNNCYPCNDYDLNTLELINTEELCYDISRTLARIFDQNKEIDFYLEIPFLPKDKLYPSKQDIADKIDMTGYIYKLYYIFYDCITKNQCPYHNVRFNYVDIRLQHQQLSESISEIIQSIASNYSGNREEHTPIILEFYVVIERIQNSLLELILMITSNKLLPNSYIEDTNTLIKELYYSGGYTMAGRVDPTNVKLFKLYLDSDNYIEDVTDVLKPTLDLLHEDISGILFPEGLTVVRNNKIQHRIRAQFWALEQEGKGELARYIRNFILNQYLSSVDNSISFTMWNQILEIYNSLIGTSTGVRFATLQTLNNRVFQLRDKLSNLETIESIGITSTSLLMDAYTLARMFRTYPGTGHIESSRVIVYAGDGHIRTYVRFFESLGTNFTKYEPNKHLLDNITPETIPNLTRCLHVDMDLFS